VILELNRDDYESMLGLVESLTLGESYCTRELASMGADGTLLACFEMLPSIPAKNVLCVCCLMLGLDVWSPRHDEPNFRCLRVRVRCHLNQLICGGVQ